MLPDPNAEFVRLKDVREVKEGLGGPPKGPNVVTRSKKVQIEEDPESDHDSDGEECIVFALVKV